MARQVLAGDMLLRSTVAYYYIVKISNWIMRRAEGLPQVPEGMQDDEVDSDVYGVKKSNKKLVSNINSDAAVRTSPSSL